MSFATELVTDKSVEAAVEAVQEALAERQFGVLWQLNVNNTLANKGLTLDHEVRILEVCSAPKAKHAIETNPEVAYLLPCKIVVKRVAGQTTIGLTRPSTLMGLLNDERFVPMAQEVERVLTEAIEAAR